MEENIKTEKENIKTEKDNKEKKEKVIVEITTITKLGLILLFIMIIYIVMTMVIERKNHRETVTNLKFERASVIQLMSKLYHQRVAQLKANFKSEQDSTNNKVKQLMSQLDQANQRVIGLERNHNKGVTNRLSQSKPALTNWVFRNSSKISKKIAKEIVDCILKTNFPLFLLALIKTESTFDPTSVSSKGALGLGQIMPRDYKKRLKKAGIISDIRDVFDVPAGVKSTEFAWNDKLVLAKGDIIKALGLYLGKKKKDYINQILKDFLYLNYLCRKPKSSPGLSHTSLEMHNGRLKIPETSKHLKGRTK